jgi:hypothetical protein
MKKNQINVISFKMLVITLSCSSCFNFPVTSDPYIVPESRQKENLYYVPSAANTQLLQEKNDLSFNLMRSANSKFSGTEFQASYLLNKHTGFTGSYSSSRNADFMKYQNFEIGAGYIKQFSKGWHFETYGGIGNGKIDNSHHTGTSTLNLTKLFIQPALAISNKSKTVQFGIVSKFSGVNFKVDTAFNNEREPFSTIQLKSLYATPFHIMWEPGFVFQFGWKKFLFHTSYTFSTDLTNSDLYKATDNFSLGASFRFNVGSKKK